MSKLLMTVLVAVGFVLLINVLPAHSTTFSRNNFKTYMSTVNGDTPVQGFETASSRNGHTSVHIASGADISYQVRCYAERNTYHYNILNLLYHPASGWYNEDTRMGNTSCDQRPCVISKTSHTDHSTTRVYETFKFPPKASQSMAGTYKCIMGVDETSVTVIIYGGETAAASTTIASTTEASTKVTVTSAAAASAAATSVDTISAASTETETTRPGAKSAVGAIAGIATGAVVAVLLITVIIIFILARNGKINTIAGVDVNRMTSDSMQKFRNMDLRRRTSESVNAILSRGASTTSMNTRPQRQASEVHKHVADIESGRAEVKRSAFSDKSKASNPQGSYDETVVPWPGPQYDEVSHSTHADYQNITQGHHGNDVRRPAPAPPSSDGGGC